jgi:hypothetical protein
MKARRYNTKSMKVGTEKVREMYNRLRAGEITQGQAALEYGLGVIQVGRIARGESRAAETGAHENPVPNFNLQIRPEDVEASMVRLRERLEGGAGTAPVKPPSLYDSPPPTEDEDRAAAQRAQDALADRLRPTARQQQVSDELDKLEKGD